jgi:hypothetical protein
MSKLEDFEDRIISAIKAVLPKVEVSAFPDKPESYKPTRENVVLISYEGRKLAEVRDTVETMATFDVVFRITFAYVNRRTVTGIYTDMEIVRAALQGLEPDPIDNNASYFALENEFFDRYNAGSKRWEYIQLYTFKEFFNNV